MKTRWLLALMCFLPSAAPAQSYRVFVTLPGWGHVPMALDTVAIPFTIDAPVGQVFAALAAVMGDLGVATDIRDSVVGLVGNATLKKTYNFAGYRLSRLQSCGMGAIGPNADSYRLYMALVGFVEEASPSKTRLRVAFAAGTTDLAGASKEASTCVSTGELEAHIADLVRKRVVVLPGK